MPARLTALFDAVQGADLGQVVGLTALRGIGPGGGGLFVAGLLIAAGRALIKADVEGHTPPPRGGWTAPLAVVQPLASVSVIRGWWFKGWKRRLQRRGWRVATVSLNGASPSGRVRALGPVAGSRWILRYPKGGEAV
jgi:hypothetical protein